MRAACLALLAVVVVGAYLAVLVLASGAAHNPTYDSCGRVDIPAEQTWCPGDQAYGPDQP